MTEQAKILAAPETEEALVGAVLTAPEVLDKPNVAAIEPGDFYLRSLGRVWQLILDLQSQGRTIDYLTVSNKLEDADVGRGEMTGAAYLAYLVSAPPSSFHADDYARDVKEFAVKRRIFRAAGDMAKLAHQPVNGAGPQGAIASAEALLSDATAGLRMKRRDRWTAAELYDLELPDTPYLLDHLVVDSGLTLLAGDFGAGKTWLALDLAIAMASGQSTAWGMDVEPGGVAFFAADNSFRMTQRRIKALTDGRGIEAPHDRLVFDFDPLAFSEPSAAAVVRQAVEETGARLLVVDAIVRYLGRFDENSAGDVGTVMASLREIANATGCGVLIVHHLRKVYGGQQTKTKLADRVRGSGDFVGAVDSALVVTSQGQGANQVRTLAQVKNRDDEEAPASTFSIMAGEAAGSVLAFEHAGALTTEATKAEVAAGIMADAVRATDDKLDREDLIAVTDAAGVEMADRTARKAFKIVESLTDVEVGKAGRKKVYSRC